MIATHYDYYSDVRGRVCDCNLTSQVTCSCRSFVCAEIIRSHVPPAPRKGTKLDRVRDAKKRRRTRIQQQNVSAIYRDWRKSSKRPPAPRIERHKRIHRHSAKG